MKCARCEAEAPGQAQFCMRCGAPITAGAPIVAGAPGPTTPVRPPASSVSRPFAVPPAPTRRFPLAAALVVLLLVVVGGVSAFLFHTRAPRTAVTEVQGAALSGQGLVDKNARLAPTAPLTEQTGIAQPGPADPVEVIDYIKHVRETERKRLALAKQQMAKMLNLSATLTASGMSAEMSDNPDKAHQQTYTNLQNDLSQWPGQWEDLSRQFMAYPKPVPQSCQPLRDSYLEVLGKTSSKFAAVGNSFASAMTGNTQGALSSLENMRGDQSVDIACDNADKQLASLSDKFHLHKDFDIRADGGASNPFGIGG